MFVLNIRPLTRFFLFCFYISLSLFILFVFMKPITVFFSLCPNVFLTLLIIMKFSPRFIAFFLLFFAFFFSFSSSGSMTFYFANYHFFLHCPLFHYFPFPFFSFYSCKSLFLNFILYLSFFSPLFTSAGISSCRNPSNQLTSIPTKPSISCIQTDIISAFFSFPIKTS